MGQDIQNIIASKPIHNGYVVVGHNNLNNFTSFPANSGETVAHLQQPVIADITGVYQDRFNNESYYVT